MGKPRLERPRRARRRHLGEAAAVAREPAWPSRADRAATGPGGARRLRERGRDVRARPRAALRVALREQLLVGEQDDVARHAQLEPQRPGRRQPRARRHLAGEDGAAKRLVDLLAERLAAPELHEHGRVASWKWYHGNRERWLFTGSTLP